MNSCQDSFFMITKGESDKVHKNMPVVSFSDKKMVFFVLNGRKHI